MALVLEGCLDGIRKLRPGADAGRERGLTTRRAGGGFPQDLTLLPHERLWGCRVMATQMLWSPTRVPWSELRNRLSLCDFAGICVSSGNPCNGCE